MTTDKTLGRILLENLALDATLTGGTWMLPLANLQNPRITSLPARCADPSDLAQSQIVATWSSAVYFTDIMLAGHSMGLDDKFRVTIKRNGNVLNTPELTNVYGRQYDTEALPWEQANWFTGKPRLSDIEAYARHRLIRLGESYAADEILIELDATASAADGEDLDVGYLIVAAPLAPYWPYTWGRTFGFTERSLREVTAGGREIIAQRIAARKHTVTFTSLSKAEAMRIYDTAIKGSIHPVVFDPDPDDTINAFREIFPAKLTVTSDPAESEIVGEWSIGVTFEELQG